MRISHPCCAPSHTVGEVHILVRVLVLVGMRRDPLDGGLYYVFGEENSSADITVAGQLLMKRLLVPDPRFSEQGPKPPAVRGLHCCSPTWRVAVATVVLCLVDINCRGSHCV